MFDQIYHTTFQLIANNFYTLTPPYESINQRMPLGIDLNNQEPQLKLFF